MQCGAAQRRSGGGGGNNGVCFSFFVCVRCEWNFVGFRLKRERDRDVAAGAADAMTFLSQIAALSNQRAVNKSEAQQCALAGLPIEVRVLPEKAERHIEATFTFFFV